MVITGFMSFNSYPDLMNSEGSNRIDFNLNMTPKMRMVIYIKIKRLSLRPVVVNG